MLMELHHITTQPTHSVTGVGSTAEVIFRDFPPFRSIYLKISMITTIILVLHNHYLHPHITKTYMGITG